MFASLLHERLGTLIDLAPAQVQQLQKHFELLIQWNKVLNLTSVREEDEIVERHYCESLFVAAHLPPGALRVADVGSGAGFPGIPIAVARPECSIALVESRQRKSVFLRESTRGLPNVKVIAKNAADVTESFDWSTSRAVEYSTIEKALSKLAKHVAILAGEQRPPGMCFTWNDPIKLPWGQRRFLWIGTERSF